MLSRKIKVALLILVVLLVLVFFGVAGIFLGYNYVISQEERFANLKASIEDGTFEITPDTEGAVSIVIEEGDMTSDIAQKLFDCKLIDNTLVFSIMSKVNGFDGSYLAGTHYLIPGLTYDEIMYLLIQEPLSVTVTFPEGITYEEIKTRLHEAGLTFSDEEFDECMDSPDLFVDYEFVSRIVINDERDHILSGYLFPDTYEFDVNASAESIINTFLRNTASKIYEDYYSRAEALNMSFDEVITLASLIQMESSNTTDMMYISAVFHNRLVTDDEALRYLGSDATINYLRSLEGLEPNIILTDADLIIDSFYNTYTHQGLPPGPICMPGLDAIQAALYPEPNCNYYYFCATGDGGTAFAVTLAEHQQNVANFQLAISEPEESEQTTSGE